MRHLGSGSTSRLGPGPKGSRAPPTSSPGAAASTFFHFAGEVVGANGSRAPVTDPAAGWPARPPLTQRAAMDIRKFFGAIPSGKNLVSDSVKKNEKTKSAEETLKTKKGIKEIKVSFTGIILNCIKG